MNILPLILLILAALLFLGAAFGASIRTWNLSALGLFFLTVAIMLLRYVASTGRAFITLVLAVALTSCATTSTVGLTKDQVNEREKQKTAWTLFGITILGKVVDAGISSFSNGGNERKLPRTFEK